MMRFVGLHLKPFSLTQCYLGLLFSVCTLALVTGCEQAGSPSDTGGEPPVAVKVNKVTAAEAEKFAKEYLSSIHRKKPSKTLQLVYWDAIVDRVFKDLPNKRDNVFYKEYSLGGKKILRKLSESIRRETGSGGSYALLKIVRRGKDRHAIFRLVTGASAPAGGGRINYHNLRLIKRDGQVRADDIYVARTGSWLSESYRNSLRPAMLKSQNPHGLFTSQEEKELAGYQLIGEMAKAVLSGNYSEASSIHQQLPEDMKKTKTVLATRLLAAEPDEFFKAVEAMLAEYPGSPAVGLRMMDFGDQQDDLETLKRASELLEKWTGGDSYIDLNVAAVMLKLGQVDEAAELSSEVDVKEFDFANPVYQKYRIALASKDNATLLKCFRIFRDDYNEDIKEVLKLDECKNFRESLEYVDLKND